MRLVVVFVLGLVLAPGCIVLEEFGQPFPDEPRPVWKKADTWAYRATISLDGTHYGSPINDPPRVEPVRLIVATDRESFEGASIYRVRVEGDPYAHAFLRPPDVAFRKTDLAFVAACVDSQEDSTNWNSDCKTGDGAATLHRVEPDTVFPWLEFPLRYQDGWDGTWKRYGQRSLRYHAEPRGVVDVTVPAGTFEAIWVHFAFSASKNYGEPGESEAVADYAYPVMTSDYYYAPSVRNMVKHVIDGSSNTYRGNLVWEMTSTNYS